MIEEKYEKYSREEKVETFKSMTLFPAGSLVGKTYKSIKRRDGFKNMKVFIDANIF